MEPHSSLLTLSVDHARYSLSLVLPILLKLLIPYNATASVFKLLACGLHVKYLKRMLVAYTEYLS